MSTTTIHRIIATLTIPKHVPDLVKLVDSVVAAMSNNPAFTGASTLLASLTAKGAALNVAQTQAATRAKGTIAVRNQARAAVVTALHQLKAYVQQVADDDPEKAEAIIQSAAMTVRKPTVRNKAPFIAKAGAVSGTAELVAKAPTHRGAYEWQWSSDGGKTWTQLAVTLKARTTVTGLPVATTCTFRFRAVTKSGEGDWSQPVTLVVK